MEKSFYYLAEKDEQLVMEDSGIIWSKFKGNDLQKFKIDDEEDIIKVSSMACYSESNLYVLVKTDQKVLINKDRAYQNGDGFHFVIAMPKEQGKPSEDFYVIAISPTLDTPRKSFVWYKNIECTGVALKNSNVKYKITDNHVYFVAQIPWDQIKPYKPYINKAYGFNVSYVHALSSDKGRNIYILKEDEYIQSEEHLREYEIFNFQQPQCEDRISAIIDLDKLNAKKSETITAKIGINSNSKEKACFNIISNNKTILESEIDLQLGLSSIDVPIAAESLDLGINNISISAKINDTIINGEFETYIYSNDEFEDILNKINNIKIIDPNNLFKQESIASLRFYYKDLMNSLKAIKSYESFKGIKKYINTIQEKIEIIRDGKDLFAYGEVIRLGFISSFDNSLQPYSLYIPKSIRENDIAGLMICLHGSGSDDTSVLKNSLNIKFAEETRMIMAAPFARGTSHCYCLEKALDDIVELTKKLKKIFHIINQPVILQGFSMGGYGVLRTYDYCQEIFDAIAVFSGHHNLPSLWGMYNEPNYLDDDKLEKFKNIDMLLYHGKKDLNCSFTEVEKFIYKLKEINKKARFIISNCGHEGLNEEWYESFKNWVMTIKSPIQK